MWSRCCLTKLPVKKRSWKNKVFVVEFIGRSNKPEVFCRKNVPKKFAKIHGKTPVSEPLF